MVFKPGGGGRPAGVCNRFSHAFLTDFLADWEQHGAAAIKTVRVRDPGCYLRTAAAILPKEQELMVETMTTGLTAEERAEMIAALRQHLLTVRQEQPMLIEAKANEPATN
jgi:hypothetical protein